MSLATLRKMAETQLGFAACVLQNPERFTQVQIVLAGMAKDRWGRELRRWDTYGLPQQQVRKPQAKAVARVAAPMWTSPPPETPYDPDTAEPDRFDTPLLHLEYERVAGFLRMKSYVLTPRGEKAKERAA